MFIVVPPALQGKIKYSPIKCQIIMIHVILLILWHCRISCNIKIKYENRVHNRVHANFTHYCAIINRVHTKLQVVEFRHCVLL